MTGLKKSGNICKKSHPKWVNHRDIVGNAAEEEENAENE